MFEGRWREGEALYRRAAELAIGRGLPGTAAGQLPHLAWLEALYRPGPDRRPACAASSPSAIERRPGARDIPLSARPLRSAWPDDAPKRWRCWPTPSAALPIRRISAPC